MNTESPFSLQEADQYPNLRYSIASFADIRGLDGALCLIINHSLWEKKHERVLCPIGGAITVTPEGEKELAGILESPPKFEEPGHLRFEGPGFKAGQIMQWINSTHHREKNPWREIREELIDETGILHKEDLEIITCGDPKIRWIYRESTRPGAEEKTTLSIFEIFPTTLSPQAMDLLKAASQQNDPFVRFVSEDDILAQKTLDGTKISSSSKYLLNRS
jgi:hypothetical protein